MKNEHVTRNRTIPIAMIVIATIVLSIVLGVKKEIDWESAICVLFVDMLFLFVFVYELEYERLNGLIAKHIETTLLRVAIGYVVCCLIGILFLICPEFFVPVMLFPILMSAVGNEFLGISTGMFLVTLYAAVCDASSYEVIAYMFLVLLAGGLVKTLTKQEYRLNVSFLLFCANLIVPFLFYFMTYQRFDGMNVIYGGGSGLLSGLAAFFVFPWTRKSTEKELENHLNRIVSEQYDEVLRLKTQFPREYAHAKKVSQIAVHIAQILGFDTTLCCAAGFYYRIGEWGSEDWQDASIEGVERAQLLNFPRDLVHIIAEYNGKRYKPSTPESAVIHMIDAITGYLESDEGMEEKNIWNQDMLIYQKLNTFSGSGLYDESGLGMNQFLRVRAILAKEKLLQ
jgi:hypothetical protein